MVSMPDGLRVVLITGSLFVTIYVVYNSVKSKMDVKYAILWITWALFILVIGIKPELAEKLGNLIGFQSVSNFVFLVMIALLFIFNYYAYVKMSHMNQDMKRISYEIAELRKQLKEMEKHE